MSFVGNAVLQGGSTTLMSLIITDSPDLVGMTIISSSAFSGGYSPTTMTAGITLPSTNFNELKGLFNGGANTVPITLTVDANDKATEFCYNNTTCVRANGLFVKAARVDAAVPSSSAKAPTAKDTSGSATGTER